MRIDYVPEGGSDIILALTSRVRHIEQISPRIVMASEIVYEATRLWFDSAGEGTWPALAASTVSRKAAQGAGEPSRPLYMEGTLYESVTSRTGPHSFFMAWPDAVIFGVDWKVGGVNIPDVLAMGTRTSGVGRRTTIPPRPIWPPIGSSIGIAMMEAVGHAILGVQTAGLPQAQMSMFGGAAQGHVGGPPVFLT